jgi:hypothetical protein
LCTILAAEKEEVVVAEGTGAAVTVLATVAIALTGTTVATGAETEAAAGAWADNNQPKSGSHSGRNSCSERRSGGKCDFFQMAPMPLQSV